MITDDNAQYDCGCPRWVLVLAAVVVALALAAAAALMYTGLDRLTTVERPGYNTATKGETQCLTNLG